MTITMVIMFSVVKLMVLMIFTMTVVVAWWCKITDVLVLVIVAVVVLVAEVVLR